MLVLVLKHINDDDVPILSLQNSTWFTFLFVVVGLVIYGVRMFIYLRRKKKRAILSTIERENFEETGEHENKPV